MKKILIASTCVIGMVMSASADYAMRGAGERAINDVANWGGAPSLTENTGYRIASAAGTTGTVVSADNITLMSTTANVLHLGDIAGYTGALKMDGGTLNVAGKLRAGAIGTGTGIVTVADGTLNVGSDMEVARYHAGAVAIITVSGGALDVANNILIGNTAISGEAAVFNYTGGSVSAGGQFQVSDGHVSIQLGVTPITCSQRTGGATGLARLSVILPDGYSHVVGTTNVLISSASSSGLFTLVADGQEMAMVNGQTVSVDGYDFVVLATATQLGLIAAGTTDRSMINGPMGSTASWWNKSLNADANYRLRGIGTISSSDNFTLTYAGNLANNLLVGDQNGNDAKVNMDGGNFTIAGNLRLGSATGAAGTLNLSNGTLTVQSQLQLARFDDGTTGVVNMSGGTLDVSSHILLGAYNRTGETAVFNYTGGTVSVGEQFQILDGQLNFTLGLDPITCTARTGAIGDTARVAIVFPAGYSHLTGTTNVFVSSVSSGVTNNPPTLFTLDTDSGWQTMMSGDLVKIDGYNFEVIDSQAVLGLVALAVDPANISFEFDGTNLIIGSDDLSVSASSNVLQSTENLVNPDWQNLYSVSGVASTNWTITPSKDKEFFRVQTYD